MKRTRKSAIQQYKLHGETFYRVHFQYRGIRVKRAGFYSIAAAKHFENEARYKIATGTWQPKAAYDIDRITFSDFVNNIWIPQCSIVIARDNTRINRISRINNHLIPLFGSRRLKELRQADVTGLKAHMKKQGLSHGSINNVLGDLSVLLAAASDLGIESKVKNCRFLRYQPKAQTFLTLEELNKLIAAMPAGQWRNMLRIQTALALRSGELFALTFEKVDWTNSRILIDQQADDRRRITVTKNGKAVWLPLNDMAIDAIKAQLQLRGTSHGFMFLGARTRQVIDRSSYNRCLSRAARRAGIRRRVSSHVARRSISAILCNSAMPITYIASFLRNSPAVMIRSYQRVDEQKFQEAFSKIKLDVHREMHPENPVPGTLTANTPRLNRNPSETQVLDELGIQTDANESQDMAKTDSSDQVSSDDQNTR